MQVSESSDEEMDEEGEAAGAPQGDVEGAGAGGRVKPRDPNKPSVDEVIPVYRRDCHEEVIFLIY